MSELTEGELRFIEESTNRWKMNVLRVTEMMDEIPDSVRENIDALEERYKKEFGEFYKAQKGKDEEKDADDLWYEFDNSWDEKCPEFYNVKELFKDCSKEDLKKAEPALKKAEEYFS